MVDLKPLLFMLQVEGCSEGRGGGGVGGCGVVAVHEFTEQ